MDTHGKRMPLLHLAIAVVGVMLLAALGPAAAFAAQQDASVDAGSGQQLEMTTQSAVKVPDGVGNDLSIAGVELIEWDRESSAFFL